MKKKKVLVLSDHALCTSGVGVQTRFLIEGLLSSYPGEWTFRQFGAAIQHTDYETTVVNEDFIIKPIDGFGTKELIRMTLATERPDLILIFTDPRFFIWLFEIEDEVHQMCPIAWWHVWDNLPQPSFNDVLYESTDLINCHSYLTYEMCNEKFPDKTNFVPHALPENLFYPLPKSECRSRKTAVLGPGKEDHFVALWINRNARRKRPGDLIWSWSIFLDNLEKKYGHRKATLILHTEPTDPEGPNLFNVVDHYNVRENIVFSTDRVDFEQMNTLHNISDTCINISYAEGFGLPTLESMQTGNPIIAVKTGGLTRQVVDHRDNSENGVAIDVEFKTMVGSQQVPFIYEDYASAETIASSIMKLYECGPEQRAQLGEKARAYALSEFSYEKTISMWHNTLTNLVDTWQDNHERWTCETI